MSDKQQQTISEAALRAMVLDAIQTGQIRGAKLATMPIVAFAGDTPIRLEGDTLILTFDHDMTAIEGLYEVNIEAQDSADAR